MDVEDTRRSQSDNWDEGAETPQTIPDVRLGRWISGRATVADRKGCDTWRPESRPVDRMTKTLGLAAALAAFLSLAPVLTHASDPALPAEQDKQTKHDPQEKPIPE